ncbi:MAG: NAD(P)-dependent glycerol-3-phosphate dehydrogenase [Halothiobacillus sp.]|jgi:glycerol-3-phosphate dehydrogenase (NAD(P)+)|nr:NAD(P)-dependent glycerol-3-phosphate dehydrogenase [Halothiobacillus sp.]
MHSSIIAVLGAGSWGTALAKVLAENGHQVRLWARNPLMAERSQRDRVNARYLPECILPDDVMITADLSVAVAGAGQIWFVLPTKALGPFLPEFLDLAGPQVSPHALIVNAAKGFERGTGRRISELFASADQAGKLSTHPFVVVSGPTFAHEVATGKPSAITVASQNMAAAETVAAHLRNPRLRTYPTNDVAGVELAGGLKNVLAIAAGVSDGFGFGANARAALITRGLAELMRLGAAVDARPETFMGLAGVGDLVLTCTDDQSRNRRFGLKLAQGYGPDEALAAIGQAVEGIGAAEEGQRLAERYQVEMPIVHAVHQVLYDGVTAREAVGQLLAREPRHHEL